jgi:hypothetical protein
MNKKCLECGAELTSSEAIIYHSCEAYPQVSSGNAWIDNLTDKEASK